LSGATSRPAPPAWSTSQNEDRPRWLRLDRDGRPALSPTTG
jgi:hypothetical protein